MGIRRTIWLLAAVLGSLGDVRAVRAGGAGQNLLLVVNPDDPKALEVANAYAALRDVPANNVVFLKPPPSWQSDTDWLSQADVMNSYLVPLAQTIAGRGIGSQIDYIGTIGQPYIYVVTAQSETPLTTGNALNYALSLLTPLTNGSGLTLQNATLRYPYGPLSGLYQDPVNIPIGANPAVHHADSYDVYYALASTTIATQYYMSGTIGYTGTRGNTVAEVTAGLRKAAAADGTYPSGAVYFEDNSDQARSGTRRGQWLSTQSQLTARGIPWVAEYSTSGYTPQGRSNVLGAVTGRDYLTLPNGSTYLPGSWADTLTSFGCKFDTPAQTKATAFIAAGAAGTTGSVVEPYAISDRFTNSSIYTFLADGSTLGEALAKSVASPDIQMPLGDMLAQPFADVPSVSITSGPAHYATVKGTVAIGASAVLGSSPRIATGIGGLRLFVDGLAVPGDVVSGGSGTFTLDTTDLSDGVHEVRISATNNAAAASEGHVIRQIVVNNRGRAVTFTGGDLTVVSSPAAVGVSAASGDGTVSRIELTCLGRVVGQVNGASGTISVDPGTLANGDNVLVPVAVFSDGTRTSGGAVTMHRQSGTPSEWGNGAGTGLWSNPSNWTGGVLPENGDKVARFRGAGGGTVTVDGSVTIEEIAFDNAAGNYTLAAAPGQAMTLTSANGAASQCLVNVIHGSHTIASPLVLASPGNLIAVSNASDTLTISGSVSGSGGLAKTGSGLVVLSGNNSYTGATTISGGTLAIGNGGASATLVSPSIANNGALVFNHAGTLEYAGTIAGSGSLTKTGSGLLLLSAANTYTGGTQVAAGSLQAKTPAALPAFGLPGSLSVTSGAALVVSAGGPGEWTAADLGTLLGNSAAFAPGSVLGIDTSSGNFSYAGNVVLSGTGLKKLGPGTLVLSGSNTYGGGTTISAGVVQFAADSAVPSGTGNIVVQSGAALTLAASGTYSTAAGWLASGKIAPGSTGALALIGDSSEAIDLSAYGSLGLGCLGNVTYSGTITPAGSTWNLGGGGGTLTVSSFLGGARGVAINGPGTVVLANAANTYGGGTILNGGALSFSSLGALGTGPIMLGGGTLHYADGNTADISTRSVTVGLPGGTIDTGNNSSIVLANAIGNGGTGALTKTGTGMLVLAMGETSSGPVNVMAGTLAIGNGGLGATVAGASIRNEGALVFNHAGTLSYSGAISGAGTLTKSGDGLLVLSGNNTYSGTTTINSGSLQIGNGGAGEGLASAGIVNYGWLVFNHAEALTYSGAISGDGLLMKSGSGLLVLSQGTACTGQVKIDDGTLQIGNGGPGAVLASSSIADNGSLVFDHANALSYVGAVSGTGSLVKAGSGALALSGANSFSGGTQINAGTLQATAPTALPGYSSAGRLFVAAGATLAVNAGGAGEWTAANIGSLLGNSTALAPGASLGIDTSGGDFEYAGNITNSGLGLVKLGTHTLTLNGNNTHSGDTEIQAGVLKLGNSLALLSSTVLLSGGSLDLNGLSAVLGGLAGDGDLAMGNAVLTVGGNGAKTTYSGALSGAGSLVKTGPGTLVLAGNNAYGGTTTVSSGTLQIGDGGAGAGLTSPAIANNATLVFDHATPLTYSGQISGTGILVKAGPGKLFLAGTANTYGGSTSVNAGTLQAKATGSLPGYNAAGKVQVAPGAALAVNVGGAGEWGPADVNTLLAYASFTSGSVIEFDTSNSASAFTYSYNISGGLGVTKSGPGTLVLPTAGSFTGPSVVRGGTLQVGDASAAQLPSRAYLLENGASLVLGANLTAKPDHISHYPTLAVAGNGNVTFVGQSNGWVGTDLTTLTYTGTTTIALDPMDPGGTNYPFSSAVYVEGGLSHGLPASTVLNMVSGRLVLLQDQVVSGLVGSGGTIFCDNYFEATPAAATLTVNVPAGVVNTFGGVLGANPILGNNGTLSLKLGGPGTLRLTADNTYTGETTVLAGTLELASPGAVPAGGNLTIGPGARVVLESFLYQSTGTKAARDAGPASVPEPGTMVLLVAGAVLGLGGWVKRWGLKYWGRKT